MGRKMSNCVEFRVCRYWWKSRLVSIGTGKSLDIQCKCLYFNVCNLFDLIQKNHLMCFKYYARLAPYPHTQVVGEELFQNNFIPSDTDFRIFRDFGNMPGN